MTTIDDTLAERGARYGDFTDHARVAQRLQFNLRDKTNWARLSDVQRQALTVICDKLARIVTGDPNYHDNWHDIQGYAKLVEDRLPRAEPAPIADTDGWTEWRGGEQPVPDNTLVEIRLRDGVKNKAHAYVWNWAHDEPNAAFNIVAYRILKD